MTAAVKPAFTPRPGTYERSSHLFLCTLAEQYTIRELTHLAREADTRRHVAIAMGDDVEEGLWTWACETWKDAVVFRRYADAVVTAEHERRTGRPTRRRDYAAVKASVDLVDYVNRYTTLRKAGRTFKGLCPVHTERTPSFVVYPDEQRWHCFGCGKGGDLFDFCEAVGKPWRWSA